jgi:hypothetical protein
MMLFEEDKPRRKFGLREKEANEKINNPWAQHLTKTMKVLTSKEYGL